MRTRLLALLRLPLPPRCQLCGERRRQMQAHVWVDHFGEMAL